KPTRKARCVAMRAMARTILVFLASAAPVAQAQPSESPPGPSGARSAAAPPETTPGDRDDDDVDLYIKTSMARQHIPGLSLALIRDGKIIKAKGYGHASVELNVPASPTTASPLASPT